MSEVTEISKSIRKSSKTRLKFRAILVATVFVIFVASFFFPKHEMTDEQYREICEALVSEQSWEELRSVATEWSEVASLPDEALFNLADAHLRLDESELAISTLLEVPYRSPKLFAALITACDLQFGPGNSPLGGVETLKRMKAMRPDSVTTRQRLIFFYAVTLQRNHMLEEIYQAIADQSEPPDTYVYLLLSDNLNFSNGFTKNTEWLQSDPESEVFQVARIVQLIKSVEQSENQRLKDGLGQYFETFETLRKQFPENAVLLQFALSRVVDEFDLEEAERLVAQIPAENRDSVLLRRKAWLKFQQGEFEECRTLLEQSLAEHALDWHTWHDLAACRRRQGDTQGAQQASQIAVQGKELGKILLQLSDAAAIPPETLLSISKYAEACGNQPVSVAVYRHLQMAGPIPQ